MAELVPSSATITSRDIAVLVESRHDSVKRTIERLVVHEVIESPPLVEIRTATNTGTAYAFRGERGKRDSIVVVAQLSPQFTARLVDRWQELEAQVPRGDAMAALQDPEQLRELLLGYATRQIELETTVAAQAPKVEALDRLASARGALCLTDAAKALQMRRKDLLCWMQERAWIHKRDGTAWKAYAQRISSGHLVHKVVTRGEGVEQRIFDQVLVTPKGLARLSELLEQPAPVLGGMRR